MGVERLQPTPNYKAKAKALLTPFEMLAAHERIERDPLAGSVERLNSTEYDPVRFIIYPRRGQTVRETQVKILYVVLDGGDRILLLDASSLSEWERWRNDPKTVSLIARALAALLGGIS